MFINTDRLVKGCNALGIALTQEQIEQLLIFYERLIEKNKVMNLTAITQWDEVVTKHFIDSLSLVRSVQFFSGEKVLDMGTGAGFPGIPLKIVFPHLHMTLADSLGKRIHFLEEVINACRLEQVQAIHTRAEDLARKKEYREGYDLCVSRAVANLATLSEYCLPFVKVGGTFVAYKAADVDQELQQAEKALQILGGKLSGQPLSFTLPDSDIARTLVRIDKKRKTPGQYPRKSGTPAKEPIR